MAKEFTERIHRDARMNKTSQTETIEREGYLPTDKENKENPGWIT